MYIAEYTPHILRTDDFVPWVEKTVGERDSLEMVRDIQTTH
jgi:hypothetical protein